MNHTVELTEPISPRPGYSGIEEKSGPFHSFLEHTATLLFPGFLAATVWFSWKQIQAMDRLWMIWLAFPAGWALSDFLSGIVHWACDTYGTVETPVVGQSMIRPFRLHHKYPRDITTHNLVITIGNSCIAAIPVFILILYYLYSGRPSATMAFTGITFSVMAAGVVMTNQFHKWAHLEKKGKLLRFFMALHIILDEEHHDRHHEEPHTTHYCITNGMLNPILERIKFFRAAEWFLARFGFKARADDEPSAGER